MGLAGIASADEIGHSKIVDELVGSDTVAISKLNSASGADNFSVFIFRLAIADASAEFCNAFKSGNIRPVLSQHATAIGVDFDLTDAPHTGAFKAQV